MTEMRCRCWWRGEQCANRMTQEDGLCNWCGNGRTEEQLRKDPKVVIGEDGRIFGISGAGQMHDFRSDDPPGTAAACWYPDSGRVIRLVPGLAEDPERRYLPTGRVAHLIAYGHDYGSQPYADAYCGLSPQWGSAWLGSGSQREADKAAALPICAACKRCADETADFVSDLRRGGVR
jgi:hypothetical protein